jgi:multiple sugar transport system substrate-binding protein
MTNVRRRNALKTLGAAALAGSGGWLLGPQAQAAAELRYPPEKGAKLQFLRWKRFVQGDEDVWLANTLKFTQQTGVPVQVENVGYEELAP